MKTINKIKTRINQIISPLVITIQRIPTKLINTLMVLLFSLMLGCVSGSGLGLGLKTAPVISLSVSTDGRYVISAHADRFKAEGDLVLWDIQNKRKTLLAKHANAFSAFFIPNSHEFMWQDNNDIVHIQNVNGQEIKRFPHFKTEGHLMSADKSFYLAVTKYGKIYKGYGDNQVPVYTDQPIGYSTPFNLSLAGDYFTSVGNPVTLPDDPPAITHITQNPINPAIHKRSSFHGLTLWDKHTLKPLAKLYGNNYQGSALLSPDGKWVISGGENSGNYMWSTKNPKKRLTLANSKRGIYNRKTRQYDTSQLLPVPEELKEKGVVTIATIAYAFVTETDFVRLGYVTRGTDRTIIPLFTLGDPWIKAYLDLGESPKVALSRYAREMSIGSSPQAHILVTGQETGGGINVYRYHPDKKELERIWAPR